MTVLNASLKELATALAQKKISSVELTRLFLNRIEKLNPALNAFITVDAHKSLAQPRTADERLARADAGKDTGGSIRQREALSGLSGLKPTYGLVSRYAMIAFASSLDQGGPIAKSAEDLALLLNVMAGFDARDSTSVERAREDYVRDLEKPLAGLRFGVPKEHFGEGLAAHVGKAVEAALPHLDTPGAKRIPTGLHSTS